MGGRTVGREGEAHLEIASEKALWCVVKKSVKHVKDILLDLLHLLNMRLEPCMWPGDHDSSSPSKQKKRSTRSSHSGMTAREIAQLDKLDFCSPRGRRY